MQVLLHAICTWKKKKKNDDNNNNKKKTTELSSAYFLKALEKE